jgi:Fe-S-cluster containining protein
MADKEQEWYADGLKFTCTQCGNCCTGPEGYVWINEAEIKAMADHFKLLPFEFLRRYARKLNGRWSLNEIEFEGQYDCVFLAEDPATGRRGCSIYPVRPTQCRTWPFWPELLKSKRTYAEVGRRCPGTKAGLEGSGKLYPIEQIRILRDATPST